MNQSSKMVYERALILLVRYKRQMLATGQSAEIDYDTLRDAANEAKLWFHEDRPRLAYTEDMQAVEVELCSDFGVDSSLIV